MSSIEKRKLKAMVADEVRFLRNWIRAAADHRRRQPARLGADQVDGELRRPPRHAAACIELGPGTGVVTQALLERGVAPSRIASIEFNPDFCALLRQRSHGVTIIEGDAYAFNETLKGTVDGAVSRPSFPACRCSRGRSRPGAS